MKNKNLKLVHKARGDMDAQLKKNYLLSKGIECILYEESLGRLYGLTNTSLGEVEIYVKLKDFDAALKALNEIN